MPRMPSMSRSIVVGGVIMSISSVAIAAGAASAFVATPTHISQKGQAFHPGEVVLSKGDAIEIVNDDEDLLHHAYVESESFNYDSGDQKPGSRTKISFPVVGTFNVLCGIHPKMKLVVHVN